MAKNGVEFGSIDFAAGQTAGTVLVATPVSLAPGDVLTVNRPTSTGGAKDFSFTIKSYRGGS